MAPDPRFCYRGWVGADGGAALAGLRCRGDRVGGGRMLAGERSSVSEGVGRGPEVFPTRAGRTSKRGAADSAAGCIPRQSSANESVVAGGQGRLVLQLSDG